MLIDGFNTVLASNTTQSAYVLASGRSDALALGTVGAKAYRIGRELRGALVTFHGVGADNATGTYRLFGVNRINVSSGLPSYHRLYIGGGNWTLSSSLAGDGTIIPASNYRCDTLDYTAGDTTTTPKGIGAIMEAARGIGNAMAFSPADNATEALLYVPFFGAFEFVELEVIKGTATSINAQVCMVE